MSPAGMGTALGAYLLPELHFRLNENYASSTPPLKV